MKLNEMTWKDIFGYHKVDTAEELNPFFEQGYHIVSCDASYRESVGTCSVQIKGKDKEYKVKDKPFSAIGPVESEILSILHGVREVQKNKSAKKVLFTNDNVSAINLVLGNHDRKQNHIIRAVDKVRNELSKLTIPYEFAQVKSKVNKKVDKSAKRKLKSRETVIEKRIRERKDKISKVQERAQNLECKQDGTNYLVKSSNSETWYAVNLDILSCSCPYWKNNWSKKPEGAKWTRATPCKHMCRAADFGSQNILEIFRSQVFRRK
ncbi:MAG: hypothetical protein KKB31_01070 [Nanoarchaeota archaeon]|nr:hypothetical protein [Nanoarchaeota archaeon]